MWGGGGIEKGEGRTYGANELVTWDEGRKAWNIYIYINMVGLGKL